MKILVINNLWQRGGAEVVVQNLVAELKREHQISVVTGGYQNEVIEAEGIKHYYLRAGNIFNFLDINRQPYGLRLIWHLVDLFNMVNYFKLKKIVLAEQPELVLTHSLMGLAFLGPRLLAKLKIKNIQTIHDLQLLHPGGLQQVGQEKVLNSLMAKLYQLVTKKLMGSPAKVIFPSQWIKDLFEQKKFFPQSIKLVLPNPVSAELLAVKTKREAKTVSSLELFYAGQIEAHKGILWLVEVLKDLSLDFSLKIAGQGTKVLALQKIIAQDPRFIYLGLQNQSQIFQAYQQADFTIVPSLVYESYSLATAESLILGTPVIGVNLGGIAELVLDTRNGFLYVPGSKLSFVGALEKAKIADWLALSQQAQVSVKMVKIEDYVKQVLS
ncbi:MAG: glycosyltransferase [Candidatus Buchananbacteria bacterium]